MMLFHEIYSCYYNAVAEILTLATDGSLTTEKMQSIVKEKAFEESFLTILPALKQQKWQLLDSQLHTPLQHAPTRPLTLLEKRWLKAISLDPRVKLFDVDFSFLEEVQPLFTQDDFVLFDQYADGDPYEDPHYIAMFRMILEAIRNRKKVVIAYKSSTGNRRQFMCDPYKLEYSEKDDKFRVLIASCRFATMLNLKGVERCEIVGDAYPQAYTKAVESFDYFIMELANERNVLERAMLHFSHFKKEAQYLGENKYQLKIYYSENDEPELVIRVLSFGPFVKVTEPAAFVNQIKQRLLMQKRRGLK